MLHKCSVVAAVVVLLLGGLVHGLWTDRWQQAPEVAAAAARLGRVPLTIGSWQGETVEIDPAEIAGAGYAGCVSLRYKNASTGDAVSVLLVCGRPGRVSVHTPEACYKGAGYELVGEPTRCTLASSSRPRAPEFWQAQFARTGSPVPARMHIYWSWYAAGAWEAPSNPRLAFSRLPVLYKLYVVRETTPTDERREKDACSAFLEHLLPALERILSEAPPESSRAGPAAFRLDTDG